MIVTINRRRDKSNDSTQNRHKAEGNQKDHLTVLEALQCALSLITDEEELREIIAGTRPGP